MINASASAFVMLLHRSYSQCKSVDSNPAGSKEHVPQQKRQRFHLDLWFCLTLQNWVLDFGRPIVMVRRLHGLLRFMLFDIKFF